MPRHFAACLLCLLKSHIKEAIHYFVQKWELPSVLEESRLPTIVAFTAIALWVQQDEEYEIPFPPQYLFCQQQPGRGRAQEQKHEQQHHNSHQSAALSRDMAVGGCSLERLVLHQLEAGF